ncbi:FMN-binding protein [Lactobacillus sp. ESL0684]|uniref:FMN-binding protein n=1 Tax=Lactobacillus sp. ESL0684 TaxID=2983213 RepID=UPI0023F861B6|nr:FMN-binding protein [Lactobacillus sp. ESL0684]WEV43840.1 FMN-binding protein [Lactobacillus sp. ESL0684]
MHYVDKKIQTVRVVKSHETPGIGGKAFSQLCTEVLAANSSDIDVVSGATVTSTAYKEAVEDALSQIK